MCFSLSTNVAAVEFTYSLLAFWRRYCFRRSQYVQPQRLEHRPDIAPSWLDAGVARQWLMLCPLRRANSGKPEPTEVPSYRPKN
jgi:hypothetical protein